MRIIVDWHFIWKGWQFCIQHCIICDIITTSNVRKKYISEKIKHWTSDFLLIKMNPDADKCILKVHSKQTIQICEWESSLVGFSENVQCCWRCPTLENMTFMSYILITGNTKRYWKYNNKVLTIILAILPGKVFISKNFSCSCLICKIY